MKSRWAFEFLIDYIPYLKDHQLEFGLIVLGLFFGGILLFLFFAFSSEFGE